jgi:hydroxyacylglutathione hydrolase
LWIIIGIVVVAIGTWFFSQPATTGVPTEISSAQAYQKYQQGTFFLDVRTQEEWDQTHLANSVLIPLDQLASRLSEVPQDQDVVVICRSGRRSKEGMTLLRNAGYARVSSMSGGLLAWQAAQYPLVGTP